MTCIDLVRRHVADVIECNVLNGEDIVVAYSGGMDSSVLLDALASLRSHGAFRLTAIHFHHGLSLNASRWAGHCSRSCSERDVHLEVVNLDVPLDTGDGIESAARRLRYANMDSMATNWIALGHHSNDQAETLLLNLFRGAGVLGMCGMREVEGRYLRPLLKLSRNLLREYAEARRLEWCEDESNRNSRFTRNYLRNEVLPLLADRFPSVTQRLATSAEHFASAQRLLNDLALIDANDAPLEFPFPVINFKQIDTERAANLLRCLLTRNGLQSPPTVQLQEFVRQMRHAAPDRHPELKLAGYFLKVKRGHLELHSSGVAR